LSCAALAVALLVIATPGCSRHSDGPLPELRSIAASDLKSMLGQAQSPLTLVHVWASWCPPCREEFPTVLRFREDYAKRGLTLILVSADSPAQKGAVARFLAANGASFPSYIVANPDETFVNTLSTNWSGAIPASFFFGPGGELRTWWEGKTAYEKYRETAETQLKQETKGR